MASYLITFSGIFIVCLLGVALQVIVFSPISPITLEIPQPSSTLSNGKLQEVIKLGEGLLKEPEDVAIDKAGVVYTATRDGWIKRLHKNGTCENWWHIDSDGLLGLTITAAGDLIVCDVEKGLLKVNEEGVTVLASHVNGAKIWFADDVVESSDGMLYFSVGSTKFGRHNWELDMLEARPHGQLLRYDPSSNETSILLHDLGFANGVALSEQQDYLVFCETWKYRCLKYWLKGDIKGQTEIFIGNLPGGPDNIKLAPDGSFWIALLELVPSKLRFIHSSVALKYLIAPFPKVRKWATIRVQTKAMVVNVAGDGKIIRSFDDPTGKVMAFVTSVLEFEDHLYLGNLHSDFIGKLPLIAPSA
ncbi:hypothetical protein BUALT_Bualt09G0042600 [Buddleja alternifolia]|uniref:Strictosidine synthase conserved region domain-containing protein n=1 Tax=Buddleja alternifolia TaxID=168488 RepID=A0AAV6WZ76_9LAMI|nr:hypothetical protein BUALT_Bualt09G0042600 [Buddleja alternifolia]